MIFFLIFEIFHVIVFGPRLHRWDGVGSVGVSEDRQSLNPVLNFLSSVHCCSTHWPWPSRDVPFLWNYSTAAPSRSTAQLPGHTPRLKVGILEVQKRLEWGARWGWGDPNGSTKGYRKNSFILILWKLNYVWVILPTCMLVYHMHAVSAETRRGRCIPGTGVRDGCSLTHGCWEPKCKRTSALNHWATSPAPGGSFLLVRT